MRINGNIIPEVKVLEENNSTSMKMKKNTFLLIPSCFVFSCTLDSVHIYHHQILFQLDMLFVGIYN